MSAGLRAAAVLAGASVRIIHGVIINPRVKPITTEHSSVSLVSAGSLKATRVEISRSGTI